LPVCVISISISVSPWDVDVFCTKCPKFLIGFYPASCCKIPVHLPNIFMYMNIYAFLSFFHSVYACSNFQSAVE
jgi:hypothetical protein